MEDVDDYLLRTRDVARMLGVDVRTVRRYVKEEHLPRVVMPEGQFRFRREDVRTWLAARA